MAHIFYLRHVPAATDVVRLPLIRDVRAAMRVLDPKATASDAEACIVACRERGYGVLGVLDGEGAESILEGLRLALDECEVVMDLDTARVDKLARERKARESGFTPEQVFAGQDLQPAPDEAEPEADKVYETALLLLATLDGNPVQAAASAINLGRVQDEPEFYARVVRRLIHVFPWIETPLRSSGLL